MVKKLNSSNIGEEYDELMANAETFPVIATLADLQKKFDTEVEFDEYSVASYYSRPGNSTRD